LLKRYSLDYLVHASSLITDEATVTAVIVVPQRDINQHLAEAQTHGWQLHYMFLTHFHTGSLAGHLEQLERVGATICLDGQAQANYAFTPFHDSEALTFRQGQRTMLATPGHTLEAISILVDDYAKDLHHPYAVMTRNTLFIGTALTIRELVMEPGGRCTPVKYARFGPSPWREGKGVRRC
jgi:glyoxylase-like metal-dependent hydrolase (beta-lactamase superfamily II)